MNADTINSDRLARFATVLPRLSKVSSRARLRIVAARIDNSDVTRSVYVVACVVGAVGMVVFAAAPNAASAVAGSMLVSGIGFPITRVASTILVNRRTPSEVRATVHSFLSQAENLGEIIFGLALAFIARSASVTVALSASAALLACAGVVMSRAGE